jgi:predicted nucleotidyltransferase
VNIKITEEQANFILENCMFSKYKIGSHLYGNFTDDSDIDYLIVYESFHEKSDLIYPNYHQFQWDDVENKSQYIFTSERQFWKNLLSGDSTINADVILFYTKYNDFDKLNICRTYNVIKSFIGFTKRDIKNYKSGKGKNKLFHIARGLYCADTLLRNELPYLSLFKRLRDKSIEELQDFEVLLRNECNEMFEKNELTMYPKHPLVVPHNELELIVIISKNLNIKKIEKL